jgi:hypothetical protein
MHWLNILLPIATLIIGSVLTMLNQSLSDRRREASERRARREQFRTSNFDMHRTAMLEMQEMVRDLTGAVISERSRRDRSGDCEYFDSFRARSREPYRRLIDNWDWMERAAARIKNEGASEDERKEFAKEINKRASEVAEAAAESKSYAEKVNNYLDWRWPFNEEFIKYIRNLRLCMLRSGSNTVVQCGEEYIQAVAKWNEHIGSKGSGELYEQVVKSRARLDRALSNALTSGPYDTFRTDGE